TDSTLAMTEIEIFAPRRFVWNIHTYVNAWSRWQPAIGFAVAEQPLAPGAAFRWSTCGTAITSTVDTMVDGDCIRWSSVSGASTGFQEWRFIDTEAGVRVATVACLHGPSVAADPDGSQALLERLHAFWLRSLKDIAESR